LLLVWITRDIVARMLIWLTAIMVPIQAVPAAPCGCASSKTGCHEEGPSDACCCAGGRTAAGKSRHSCCQRQFAGPCGSTGAKLCRCGESRRCRKPDERCCAGNAIEEGCHAESKSVAFSLATCTCGLNCQCGTTSQQSPATPPVQKNPTEKLASNWLTTYSVATVYRPQTTRRQEDVSSFAGAVAALDRCASLCRFML
jgi:hypothetical protein